MKQSLFVGLFSFVVGCSQNYSPKPADQALTEHDLTRVGTSTEPRPAELPEDYSAPGDRTAGSGDTAEEGERRQSLRGISVAVPQRWEHVPPSGMRLAEYRLQAERADAPDASLTVFYFGLDRGGSIEANIDRWYGQFSQPDGSSTKDRARRWHQEIGEVLVTQVDIRGTFDGMGQTEALDGYRMLGAIAEAPSGPFFFKLVGPTATVEAWSTSYAEFIGSIRPE